MEGASPWSAAAWRRFGSDHPLSITRRRQAAALHANDIADVDDLNPATWVRESHELAKTVAYQDITENTLPSGPYREKTVETSRKRIATAGYRLARVLNQPLGN